MSDFKIITNELESHKELLTKASSSIWEFIKDALCDIDEMRRQSVNVVSEGREALRNVNSLLLKGVKFCHRVYDLHKHCSLFINIEEIMDEVKRGCITVLNINLKNMQKILSECAQIHQEFTDEAKTTQRSIDRAETKCRRMAAEAESKKKRAQVVGGTASAGMIAATAIGITGSIVAGIFTFGIGTAVGLAVTGAAVAGTATAGAVATGTTIAATVVIAEDYSDAAKTFRRLGRHFPELREATDIANKKIQDLKIAVDNHFANAISTLEIMVKKEVEQLEEQRRKREREREHERQRELQRQQQQNFLRKLFTCCGRRSNYESFVYTTNYSQNYYYCRQIRSCLQQLKSKGHEGDELCKTLQSEMNGIKTKMEKIYI